MHIITALMLAVTVPAGSEVSFGLPECARHERAAATIAAEFRASGAAYLIVNEDHNVDGHRSFSACLLENVAHGGDLIVGAEAFPGDRTIDFDALGRSPGYTGSRGFLEIMRVIERRELPAFGYDPAREDQLSDDELARLGLSQRTPNRRDHVAALRIEAARARAGASRVYLHVGHGHVSERWSVFDEGAYGWLAAHLAQISRTDPVTVYQMTQESAGWYIRRGRFQFDLDQCPRQEPGWAVLLSRNGDAIGCAERRRLQPSQDTDFIILDGGPGESQ